MADKTGDDGLPANLITGLGLGFGLGGLVGLAVRYHDGGPWSDAALVGGGFFVLGFLMGYSRTVRSLLQMLR